MTASSVVPIALSIERKAILHFLGYPEGREPSGQIGALLDGTLEEARARADARGAYVRLGVGDAERLGLEPIDAEGLVVGLVTAGEAIERRASELLRGGAPTEALLMDAAGSAAAEEAADRLGALAVGPAPMTALPAPRPEPRPRTGERMAEAAGVPPLIPVSCRISPGYGRWPMSAQRAIFRMLPHRELGIELMPTMLMLPRKSVSFAMWLGADARPLSGLAGCARCELENCRYRRG